MKKLLSIAMCLCLILSTFTFVGITASAATSGYYTYTISNDKATITECETSISGEITIPSTLGGYPVTSIGDYAFEYCESLTSITIPDSVISIGEIAFQGCTSLTSITIPNSVTSIGYYAFVDCTSLEKVNITDLEKWCEIYFENYSSNPLYYANDLYLNGKLVTNLVIPNGVMSIGDYAFIRCSSLKSVTIPDSVTSIGDYAFDRCDSLTSLTISNNVTSIGESAFSWCPSLEKVNITDIAKWCEIDFFNEYSNPLSYNNLYLNSKLVTDLVIPDNVTSISDYAFSECSSLKSITIANSVTSIGDKAFYYCNSLTSVTLGNSVASIGDKAFDGCYIDKLTFSSGTKKITKEMCISKAIEDLIIPNTVTTIEEDAFYSCEDLESVYIPSSVTQIGKHAFGYYDSEESFDAYDLLEEFVIHGEKGSVAEKYAIENGIDFVCKHKKVLKNTKSSTFFASGYTGDKVCSECGETIEKGSTIAKLTLKTPKFKLTKGKKQFKVKYTTVSGATGFQVRYKLKGKWKTKTFNSTKSITKTIKKLKKGKYSVQIRAMVVSGKQKAYSAWTKAKKVKVK